MKSKVFNYLWLSLVAMFFSLSTTSCSKDDEDMINREEKESSSSSSSSQNNDGYDYVGTVSALRVYKVGTIARKESTTMAKFRSGSTYYYALGKTSKDKKTASRNTTKLINGIDVSGYRYYCDYGVLGKFFFN